MRAHGFTADQLAELVRVGFATMTTERVVDEWRAKRSNVFGESRRDTSGTLPGTGAAKLLIPWRARQDSNL
jgi:hypothetical protein